jgi:hypothetical protein
MTKEIELLKNNLAFAIQKSQESEARAVQLYTEQLNAIDSLYYALENEPNTQEELAFLDELKSQTEEKIQDELNHEKGLLLEYVELTGIEIKED